MMSTPALGPLFTPHDDIPRWPVARWVDALGNRLAQTDPVKDFDLICIHLNNLALLGVHARDAALAQGVCHLQLNFLLGVRHLHAQRIGPAISQPLFNLMRLEMRTNGDWERGPRQWLSTPFPGVEFSAFEAVKDDNTVIAVGNRIYARELAMLAVRGRLSPAEMQAAYERHKMGQHPPPAAVTSLLAEAHIYRGCDPAGKVADLHPLVVGLYLLTLWDEFKGKRGDLEAYLTLLLQIRPCSRALAELVLKCIRRMEELDLPVPDHIGETLLRYILQLDDEVLIHQYRNDIVDMPYHLTEPSVYIEGPGVAELRKQLATRVTDVASEFMVMHRDRMESAFDCARG